MTCCVTWGKSLTLYGPQLASSKMRRSIWVDSLTRLLVKITSDIYQHADSRPQFKLPESDSLRVIGATISVFPQNTQWFHCAVSQMSSGSLPPLTLERCFLCFPASPPTQTEPIISSRALKALAIHLSDMEQSPWKTGPRKKGFTHSWWRWGSGE